MSFDYDSLMGKAKQQKESVEIDTELLEKKCPFALKMESQMS